MKKKRRRRSKNVLVSCPTNDDVNKVNPVDFETDLDYVLENFKRTETTSDPFEEIVYVCNVFPPELYEKMLSDFPLISSMEPTEKGRCSEAEIGSSQSARVIRRRVESIRGFAMEVERVRCDRSKE